MSYYIVRCEKCGHSETVSEGSALETYCSDCMQLGDQRIMVVVKEELNHTVGELNTDDLIGTGLENTIFSDSGNEGRFLD